MGGWAVTFGTARRVLGGPRLRPVPSSLYHQRGGTAHPYIGLGPSIFSMTLNDPNLYFKGTPSFDVEYLRKGTRLVSLSDLENCES